MSSIMNQLRQQIQFATLLLLGFLYGVAASRCSGHACSPPMGNLASGRTLHTSYNFNITKESQHPPALMADDPFQYPDTWWESTALEGQVEIRLDLEAQFFMTHVVMVFRSPRPAAMIFERSQDFGRTWKILKLYAENCNSTFGLPDDVNQQGALCTSRYSSAKPCTRGEVIFRSMTHSSFMDDPYSRKAIYTLSITNLRIRLLKPHQCPSSFSEHHSELHPANNSRLSNSINFWTSPINSNHSVPYAVYSLLVRGTCLCHGHAEHCLPIGTGEQNKLTSSGLVQGRCVCTHHTVGTHCEKCAPLYNDRPWRAANGSSKEPNPCQKCECHGHSQSCYFSQRVWHSTGGTSGGVCIKCQHNTEGRRCQRCRPGYRRHPARPIKSKQACIRCWCKPTGTVRSIGQEPLCHPRSGQCRCKPGVGGTSCSTCLPGFYGFGLDGCRPCMCPLACDPVNGHCLEKKTLAGFYNIPNGGKIPDLMHFNPQDEDNDWPKELTVSAVHYTGKCSCKEKKLKSVSDLCRMKYSYAIKASVLSAHDKGTHVVVQVKVKKVLRSGKVPLYQGTHSLYPLSWTSRGCTCPVLNPGVEYLLAGSEEPQSGRLLVNMQSLAVSWTPTLGFLVSEALQQGCI